VSTSIKTGTNQFHGDVFEFFRNDVLNSALWQNNFEDAAKAKLRWNEFGGTLAVPSSATSYSSLSTTRASASIRLPASARRAC